MVISEVSDADREKIAEALARSVGTFGKLGTASSLYKQPADDRIKELERQRDSLADALERMRVSGGRAEFHAAYEEALCILDNVKGGTK